MICCGPQNFIGVGRRAAAALLRAQQQLLLREQLLQQQQQQLLRTQRLRCLASLSRRTLCSKPLSCGGASQKTLRLKERPKGFPTSLEASASSRRFASASSASAAAAVPLAAGAANDTSLAAAARTTRSFVASGDAAGEVPLQQPAAAATADFSSGPGKQQQAPEGSSRSGSGSSSSDSGGEQQQQARRKPPGGPRFGILLCGAGFFGGAFFAATYMQQHNLTFSEFLKELWQRADAKMCQTHERLYNAVEDAVSAAFPQDAEPLLPDFKDLNYPEHLPTLVLDFDGVLAKIGHDRAGGYKLRKRPYSEALVHQLSHFYEVLVWTEEMPPVVQTALQQWGLPVTACLNGDNMTRRDGKRIKDFSRLGRKPERLIYVSCKDEGVEDKFRANFIRVSPFEGTATEMTQDTDLLDLLNFLKHCSLSPDDVRSSIARWGGGEDGGVGRRFDAAKKAQETKANQRRNLGRLFGLSHPQGPAGGGAPPQNNTQQGAPFPARQGF